MSENPLGEGTPATRALSPPNRGYNQRRKPSTIRTLRELRLVAGVPLRKLESLAGVNRAIISQIERGRITATREECDRIAAALGLEEGALEVRTLVVHEEEPA